MAQKNRKRYKIASFGASTLLLAAVDVAVAEQNARSRHAPLNRSEWIRRAVIRDLEHSRRSRKRKGKVIGLRIGTTNCPVKPRKNFNLLLPIHGV